MSLTTEKSEERSRAGATPRTAISAPPTRRAFAPAESKPSSHALSVLIKGAANALFVGLTVVLTYFFTTFFGARPPATGAASTAKDVQAAQKIEELRAKDRELLTTYGVSNPVTKALHIPIDRAMELTVADVGKPAPPRPPAPIAGAATTSTAPGAAPAAAAPGGLAPVQLFQAVCIACHGPDGKGTAVRIAMPVIPDFTDPKFQASRTDADLEHSILNGKGTLMLPMKDKLAMAHIDVKAMVAFMRGFQTGKQVVTPGAAAPVGLAPPTAPAGAPAAAAGAPAAAAGAVSPAAAMSAASVPAIAPLPAGSTATASPAQSAKAHAGSLVFMTNCIPCHGPDGKGTAVRAAMPVIPDFTGRAFQVSHTNAQMANSIIEGKGQLMPSWRGRVTPDQAQEVIAFIRTFGPPGLEVAENSKADFGVRLRQLQQQWQELDQQARSLSQP